MVRTIRFFLLLILSVIPALLGVSAETPAASWFPDMVLVEGGRFLMGSNDGQPDEQPVHPVELDGFLISRHEISQARWQRVMNSNPSEFKEENRPVETVSWFDAVKYCNRLSLLAKRQPAYDIKGQQVALFPGANGYRLPTEAQWEFAARGGNKSRGYTWAGSPNPAKVAWYEGNSAGSTHAVGLREPNELGIFDMSGNVWEWVEDWYAPYQPAPVRNPQGPRNGEYRVYRGGSWFYLASMTTVSYRRWAYPGLVQSNIGFRVVLPL